MFDDFEFLSRMALDLPNCRYSGHGRAVFPWLRGAAIDRVRKRRVVTGQFQHGGHEVHQMPRMVINSFDMAGNVQSLVCGPALVISRLVVAIGGVGGVITGDL